MVPSLKHRLLAGHRRVYMDNTIKYAIQNQIELNFSYMPFIKDGGLFVPTCDSYQLGDHVVIDLQLPGHTDSLLVEGTVVWITPVNSLYQIYPGIGIRLIGDQAAATHNVIKSNLDNTMDVGGYAYGMVNTAKE